MGFNSAFEGLITFRMGLCALEFEEFLGTVHLNVLHRHEDNLIMS